MMATATDHSTQPAPPHPGRDKLAGIAAKLAEITAQLQNAAEDNGGMGASLSLVEEPCGSHGSALVAARHVYWLRRQRAQIFGSADLFGEPGWDILLDLYIAQAEGKPVSVSSACIGSASPATTGLRWLAVLAEQGLITREADEQDQRRIMVRLSDHGIAAMERFLMLARGRPA